LFGALNSSAPSRKNGRFSGKKIALRGSKVNWPASDFCFQLNLDQFAAPGITGEQEIKRSEKYKTSDLLFS